MKSSRNIRNYFRIAAEIKTQRIILGLLPIITFVLGFGEALSHKQAHRLQ